MVAEEFLVSAERLIIFRTQEECQEKKNTYTKRMQKISDLIRDYLKNM